MARPCSICQHPQREAIEVALAAGETIRGIARRVAASEDAIARHKAEHMPALLAVAHAGQEARQQAHAAALAQQVTHQAAAQEAHALDVMAELHRCFARMNLLFDACHTWLQDPDDPTRYTLVPRADDVTVLYLGTGPDGKPARKKAPLSRLLAKLDDAGVVVDRWEAKHADPRELAIKVAAQLKGQTELLAKLLGDLQQEGTITLTLSPEWHSLRAALLDALVPYPEARTAAAARLVALEASATPAATNGTNGAGGGVHGHAGR